MAETNHNQKRQRQTPSVDGRAIALNVGKVLGTLLLIGITTCAILACFATVYIKTVIMPQTAVDAGSFALNLSSTIYYTDPATGEDRELRTLHGGENRVWVAYKDIPENLIHAAVSVEDKRFYKHNGVDWWRTGGAFVNMFLGMKNTYGGSTLTQQLIKNITDQDDVTVKRKILEIFRAIEFEKSHSKEEILEMYLNYIYFGESSYGVYTAAYTYFGKNVSELSLAECASLIGITNNPSMYDPYISDTTKKSNKARQEIILDLMCDDVDTGYITDEERDAAKAEVLQFQRGEDDSRPLTIYSWYEDQVIRDVIDDLVTTKQWSKEVASQAVYNGGLSIYSCYNPTAQSIVDSVYGNTENLPYKSTTGQNIQSAVVVIDNVTGNVAALSGGIGEKEKSLIFNRATQSKRPPGSSIKPLAVYSPAIEMGLISPATVIDDSPYTNDGSPWPVNAVGYFKGLTTVYEALQNSVNTVAVKIMGDYTTPDLAYDFVTEKFGITSLEPGRVIGDKVYSDKVIAALALGGLTDGVSPLEMAAAFSVFPRYGTYITPRTYTKVVANDGVTILLDNQPETTVAIKESTAWYMNTMLKNAVANGTGSSANFSGMEVAGKTGTTSSRKDLWFVGYTPYYTAAVWTGFDQQERMGSSLNNPSTVMWKKVMSQLHENLEYRDFATPDALADQLINRSYCKDSGLIPTDDCALDPRGGRVTSGTFVKGDEPSGYCTVHQKVTVCIDAPILNADGQPTGLFRQAGPYCPTESKKEVAMVNYVREGAATAAATQDHNYMLSYYKELGDAAFCTVHTIEAPAETPPPTFETIDPMDPGTWPDTEAYPNFNPFDPTTWPGYTPPETEAPAPSEALPEYSPAPGEGAPGIPIFGR